jgi:hypothetical protein
MILLPKEYMIIKGVVVTIEHLIEDYRKAKADGDITWDEALDGIKDIAKNLILGAFMGFDIPTEASTPIVDTSPQPIDVTLSKTQVEEQVKTLERFGIRLGPTATEALKASLSRWGSMSKQEKVKAIDKAMDSVEGLFLDRPKLFNACKLVRGVLGVPDDNEEIGT